MTVTSTSVPQQSSGLLTLFSALKARWIQNRKYRQTLRELSRLSNRELEDMGLLRSNLEHVIYHAIYDGRDIR